MKRLLICLGVLFLLTSCAQDFSDGSRVGVVEKFSKKGIVWKSWEGYLVIQRQRLRQRDNVATADNIWNFSAIDEKIAAELDVAQTDGGVYKLTYRQWLLKPPSQDSAYTVVKVEKVR